MVHRGGEEGGDIDVSTKCAISDTSPARVMESKWLRSLDRPSDDVVVWWQSKCSLVWWSSVAGNLDFSHCCFSCPCPLALEKRRQSQIKNPPSLKLWRVKEVKT